MNKWLKISLYIAAILAVIFLVLNFGTNFWLKNNLPKYIQKNSDYKVAYKTLNVDLGTGNILATSVTVASKNPNNQNVIGLDGTLDTLKISRLGIYDALFNKKISSSDLMMANANLKITLAKPVNDKTGRKRNPVLFENIRIKNGNIAIFRHTKQKFVAVNDLDLKVENLQMTEESVENKLPVVFDKYDIQGKNFYFRPDNIYAMKALNISTKDGLMNIQRFQLIPLLTYDQFRRFFPKKRNLFNFIAKEMDFKDIALKDNKISLSHMRFQDPVLKMYTTNVKPEEKQKSFKYDVNLDDVVLKNAYIEIYKPNQSRLFAAESLDMSVSKMKMDEETARGNIPFNYEKFLISGHNLNYISATQNILVQKAAVNPQSIETRGISVKPIVDFSQKPLFDFTIGHLYAIVNSWKFENNKLKADVKNVVVEALNGKFTAPENENRKKASLSQISLPLIVRNVELRNSNLAIDRPDNPMVLHDLNARVQNFEMNAETVAQNTPFKVGDYAFTTKNFTYTTKFYTFGIGLFKFQKGNFQINNFAMSPNFSRAQFIKMIPSEKDLYTIKVNQVSGRGNWDVISKNRFVNVSEIVLNNIDANIFRSKLPKDDTSTKPMYSALLRSIPFPFFVGNLDMKNAKLVYEEDTKQSDGPGKLIFGNLAMNVKNLNSAKMPGKPTQIPISIDCSFMNASPMKVKWNMNTAEASDAFTIAGNITNLPASSINPFIQPYLKITATGIIQNLDFNFHGNKAILNGTMAMKHDNLKISVRNSDGEKNKLLSALVNMVVRTTTGKLPENAVVDDVKRDVTKSFFNFFWQGIQEGLKKILIGRNVEKQENTVKNTVQSAKTVLVQKNEANTKDGIKNANQGAQQKENETPRKGSFLKRIFHKK